MSTPSEAMIAMDEEEVHDGPGKKPTPHSLFPILSEKCEKSTINSVAGGFPEKSRVNVIQQHELSFLVFTQSHILVKCYKVNFSVLLITFS